jgi:hypothetical protein
MLYFSFIHSSFVEQYIKNILMKYVFNSEYNFIDFIKKNKKEKEKNKFIFLIIDSHNFYLNLDMIYIKSNNHFY